MANRDEIVSYLDGLLDSPGFPDYGPNGLQVPGADDVELVVSGVSAQAELFERAAAAGAQMVLAHHGIFWGPNAGPITPQLRRRLKLLFDADMSLAAYHLPLDAHPEVGNNALICAALGLELSERIGYFEGRPVGFVGRSGGGIAIDELRRRCRDVFDGREPLIQGAGPEIVHSVGILSGSAASSIGDAIAMGLDAFLTGEPRENVMADAREGNIHFIAAGHYATETSGIQHIGEMVAERFGVEHRFLDIPNPV
jgi:dinuclear metal center YbgI/SA1388 family protein